MNQEEPNSATKTPDKQPIWYALRTLQVWVKVTLVALLALLSYLLLHHFTPITPPSLLYIPDSNQTGTLLTAMERQGVSFNLLDYRLLKRYGAFKKGWVRFDPKTSLSREDFLQALQTKPREKTRRIVMYAGDTLEEFATKTAQQTRLTSDEIIQQYRYHSPYQDGGIIAGYYAIPYRTTASAILYYMTASSQQWFIRWAEEYQGSYDPNAWNRILTIASIIQKETQDPKEMPLISSVIHNRLAKEMKLQLDATLNYGPYSHQVVTPKRIREDHTLFNTYRHKGLPPHPIGSASKEAILAALKPAKTDYLYFMLADNGTHNFAATYAEHLAHIRWYKAHKKRSHTPISDAE